MLEGIGLIEKKSKNNIQWRGNGALDNDDMVQEYQATQREISDMKVSPALPYHAAGALIEHVSKLAQPAVLPAYS